MGTRSYSRPTTEAEERERARREVRAAAKRGEDPDRLWPAQDLQWAFRGHEAELEQLRKEAAGYGDRKHRAERGRELRRMIEVVLNELKAAEEAELRRRATVEARRRLGLEEECE